MNRSGEMIGGRYGINDRDHLGKIIACVADLECKTALWICSDPRPEHVKAVSSLNETSPADIFVYLEEVDAIKISKVLPGA